MAISFAEQSKKIEEEIRALEAKKQEIQSKAHDEAKKAADAAVAALNELGYSYRLVEGGRMGSAMPPRARKSSGEGKATRAPSTGPCPICKFETSPHHDARKHRSQPEGQKKPFTAEELTGLGLTKV
jgi:hypothetical protein